MRKKMFNTLKNLFQKKPDAVDEPKPKKPKVKKVIVAPVVSEKDKATAAGEPYVNILRMDVDPNNINEGSFELDWNSLFIARLVKAGYMMKKEDSETVRIERWFSQVCRNVALEVYEQAIADPSNRDLRAMQTKDLGNGRTEVS